MTEEQHDPWVKRLLIGFARTSEYTGPRKPGGPHQLIQEIDSELPVAKPALKLTYQIFGSCPPMQSFDPAKLLTVRIFFLSCTHTPPLSLHTCKMLILLCELTFVVYIPPT